MSSSCTGTGGTRPAPPAIVDDALAAAERRAKRSAQELDGYYESAIRKMEESKRRLTAAKRQDELISKLWRDGALAWYPLDEENKWQKAHLLAVFGSSASTPLPFAMREEQWQNSSESIRDDRDLLLARLARTEFADYYSSSKMPFKLPKKFQGDKEVVVAAVRRVPKQVLSHLLAPFLNDSDVFRAFFRSEQLKGPPDGVDDKSVGQLLQKFSLSIRSDPGLMSEAAKHLGPSILDYCSTKLLDTVKFAHWFAIALDQVPGDALGRFSERVRSNPFAVPAFVKRNGLCLKDIGLSLRSNVAIARAACQNDPTALSLCASVKVRRQLGTDKPFMLNTFSRVSPAQGDPAFFRLLSPENQLDSDLILAAYRANSLQIGDLPGNLSTDRDFWTAIIRQEPLFWYKLPNAFARDPVFARTIVSFPNIKLVQDIFARFRLLTADKAIWKLIIAPFCTTSTDLIREHAPVQILRDEETMLLACRTNHRAFELVDTQLLQSENFVATVLEDCSIGNLHSFPKSAQSLHPELVVKMLRDMANDGQDLDETDVVAMDAELWTNLDVVTAYFQAGGYVHEGFPESVKANEEFGLIVAKYCHEDPDFDDEGDEPTLLERATSLALRSSKAFMMQAVEARGLHLLSAATVALKRDFDLVVLALGGPSVCSAGARTVVYALLEVGDDDLAFEKFVFLLELRKTLREKIQAYEGITQGLNRGMSDHAGTNCPLRMLVSDGVTTVGLKKQIAYFLGMPTGQEIKLFRRAERNLQWLSIRALRFDYY